MRLVPTLTASVLALASWLLLVDHASAAPPPGESFDIRYYTTDEDGERSRQFTSYDLQGYVNKARCECGQSVSARVRINNQATDLDNVQIQTFVGNNCDTAQQSQGVGMYRPCPLVVDAYTNSYTRNIDFTFHPLWLATGISLGDNSPIDIDNAIANANCEAGQGNGGIWICIENGMSAACQADEFVVKGTQNLNSGMTEEQMGIRFDFTPPILTVESPKVASGDGAVEVSWKNTASGAIDGGFRILCSTADGQPVPGKGFELSSVTAQNRGTIYFTKENLCPDGPFSEVQITDNPSTPLPGGGTTDPTSGGSESGSDTGDGDTGGDDTGGSGVGVEFGDPIDPQHGGSTCCTAHAMAGCDHPGCQGLVCDGDADDPCCADAWSDACVAEAAMECMSCGGAGDCCSAHSSVGCSDDMCWGDVCNMNASCCKGEWTDACATLAVETCSVCMDESTTNVTTDVTTTPTTLTATDGSTDTDGTATDTDTGGPMIDSPLGSLDWKFVCSGYIAPAASSARINGLENGTEYHVLVVAYDKAGNPTIASDVLTAIPRETTDLWEQCEMQGNICGPGGFCNCTASEPTPDDDAQWLLVLALFGLRRRRRAA